RADDTADLRHAAELHLDQEPRTYQHVPWLDLAVLLHDTIRDLLPAAVLPRHQQGDRGSREARRRRTLADLLQNHPADELGAHHHAVHPYLHQPVERLLLATAGRRQGQRARTYRRARCVQIPDSGRQPGLGRPHGRSLGCRTPDPHLVLRVREEDRQLDRLLGLEVTHLTINNPGDLAEVTTRKDLPTMARMRKKLGAVLVGAAALS